ncbi:LlaJI family restriction endonuclease [Wohlfahrtiimonas chitiniclastica]|uniref:LlaJI family restriction endonuclease n=1 Tax=Wohlfahrtiimonas chitiniclastica TaxID=400946 RepID=UPI001BCB7CA3|nr:LlaJI family restriction endonuclease [Wohlfahrtiimonas chitiniclastica]MBS7818989.1 LlaJI family restriction endonuclease [Wohlfahrtiimonas chitiniclastica]
MEYRYFEDKATLDQARVPHEVYEKLLSVGGLDINDYRIRIVFCGAIIFDDCTYCFLPAKSSTKNIKAIASLMKVIHAYNDAVNSSLLLHDEDNEGCLIEGVSITDLGKILDLFFSVGILRSKKYLSNNEKGRINWNKTVNRTFPMISHDNFPIYMDLQRYPISIYQDDIVSSIHAEIILEILRKFSWLDDRLAYLSERQLSEKIIPMELSVDQKILLLKQKLHATFISLEIRTLNLLIKYLERRKREGAQEIVIGIKKFHYVWEFLLKSIFSDVDHKINSALPIPQYHYNDPSKMPYDSAEKGMRIDIFIKTLEHCWIVDSKYYSATNPQTAPGWSDLVKQFFYVKAIRLLYPEITMSNIRNVFIFPGSDQILSKIQMTYRNQNYNTPEAAHRLLDDFFPIKCLYLDPIDVMDTFINNQKINISDVVK